MKRFIALFLCLAFLCLPMEARRRWIPKPSIGGGGTDPGAPGLFWNKFTNGSGTTATSAVGPNLNLGGTTAVAWTTGSTGGNGATQYTSANQNSAQSASTIAYGTNVITLSFWMNWTAFANDDSLAAEGNSNYNNTNSWVVNPNSSGGGGVFYVSMSATSTSYFTVSIVRPSAATWHHYMFVLNASSATNVITCYVDGALVTATNQASTKTSTTNFDTATLNLMSRNAGSLFGTGKIADWRIYSGALTASNALYLYNNPQ